MTCVKPATWWSEGKSELALVAKCVLRDRHTLTTGGILLFLTLALILTFVAGYLLTDYSGLAILARWELDISVDGGLSENFGYGLAFLSATLFLVFFLQTRLRSALFLAILFGFVWFDDVARYHERIGENFAEYFDFQPLFGLRPQDYGELLAWAIAGVVMGVLLILVWVTRKPGDLGILLAGLICFVILVIFGIGADMLHTIYERFFIFGVIEDGGEMLALVATATLAIGLLRNAECYISAHS